MPSHTEEPNEFFTQNTDLPTNLTHKYVRANPVAHSYFPDLEEAGLVALWKASKTFVPKDGHRTNFRSYAYSQVWFALSDFAREFLWFRRRNGVDPVSYLRVPTEPLVFEDGKSSAVLGVSYLPHEDDQIHHGMEEYGFTVSQFLAKIPEARLRRIAFLRYQDGCSLIEIGQEIGVTESRACQLMRVVEDEVRSVAVQLDLIAA